MAWVAPPTFVSGNALTAAQLNILSGDLNETAAAKFTAASQFFVSTGSNSGVARTAVQDNYTGGGTDSTNSTSYIGLTGSPSLGTGTGTKALVMNSSSLGNDTAGNRSYASYEISGATSVSPNDFWAVIYDENSTGRIIKASWVQIHTGLTAGTNVFTQRFKVNGGTGTFTLRSLAIVPF
jgi:hypothetical protein